MAEDRAGIEERVRATATEFGVDPDFAVRVVGAESSFNPKAIGPVTRSGERARGLMQVMPATSKELRTRYGDDNIRQGVGYLKEMHDMFADVDESQRPYFAAAAYNWGPGHMIRAAKRVREAGGNALNLGDYADVLPLETVKYVSKLREGDNRQSTQVSMTEQVTEQPTAQPRQPGRMNESLGTAIYRSLAHEGERQRAAVGRAVEGARGLVRPTGKATPLQALEASRDAILGGFDALQPVYAPMMTAGAVGGETAARTGAIPVSPETGATIGALGGALVSPGIPGAASATRVLKPVVRATNRLTKFLAAPALGASGAAAIMGDKESAKAYAAAAGILLAHGGVRTLDRMLNSKAGLAAIQMLGKYGTQGPVKKLVAGTLGRVSRDQGQGQQVAIPGPIGNPRDFTL